MAYTEFVFMKRQSDQGEIQVVRGLRGCTVFVNVLPDQGENDSVLRGCIYEYTVWSDRKIIHIEVVFINILSDEGENHVVQYTEAVFMNIRLIR
jgi:hypothetical protein